MPISQELYAGKEALICQEYLDGSSKDFLREKYHCHTSKIVQILRAQHIKERTRSECKQEYNLNQCYFDNIDSAQKAYALGFLWADGCLTKIGQLSVSLAATDICVLETLKQFLNSGHPIETGIRKGGYGDGKPFVRLTIVNQHLAQALRKIGMCQRKTFDIQWPIGLPESLESHFIRGYIDGDGCWTCQPRVRKRNKEHRGIVIFEGCVNIAVNSKFAPYFANKLYHHTKLKFGIGKHMSPVISQVRISGRNKMIKFGHWLYQDSEGCRLERKHQKFLDTINFYSQRVTS